MAPTQYALTGPAPALFGELREAMMAIFERGKTQGIGLKTRVAAAEAPDRASQSRLRTPGDPDYWIDIPGGKFKIGDPQAFQVDCIAKHYRTVGGDGVNGSASSVKVN